MHAAFSILIDFINITTTQLKKTHNVCMS